MQHIILTLEAPLMSFGTNKVDHLRPTGAFPGTAMLTGIIARAIGYPIQDPRWHNLQQRLRFACRIDRQTQDNLPLKEYQTANISHKDTGWTTRGKPESRAGGAEKYNSAHIMLLEFHMDMLITVALTLHKPDDTPTLEQIAHALQKPQHPFFIGRKSCLPSGPIFTGWVQAPTSLEAVLSAPCADTKSLADNVNVSWPVNDAKPEDHAVANAIQARFTDKLDPTSRLHTGQTVTWQGQVPKELLILSSTHQRSTN